MKAGNIYVTIYIVWFLIGLTLLLTIGIPHSLAWSGGVYLILSAGISMMILAKSLKKQTALFVAIILAMAGWIIEWYGVHTGFPFGRYRYSNGLGPALSGVPIAIASAWVSVTIIGWSLTPSSLSRPKRIVTAALLTTSLDFLIDPVATRIIHDWSWNTHGGFYGVPWMNFFAWFFISLIIQSALSIIPILSYPSGLSWLLFGTLGGMFAIIAIVHSFFIPALVGLVPGLASGLAAARNGPQKNKLPSWYEGILK